MKQKKVPQTKVFRQWSKWWYWDKQGQMVGPHDERDTALLACNRYLRRVQWSKKHE